MNLKDLKEKYNAYTYLSGEEALEAVKQDEFVLKYVKEQTPEICLEAVKQNGYALQYVKDQTEEICLEAVKQDGFVLRYVKEQTPEICLEAVKQNGEALRYVNPDIFKELENQEDMVDLGDGIIL
ncbi:MAG: DUF4116 domain-containing protein, partial [Candidatus Lokiarchaeota archaeon]|nr:DUF4116 domain-containing protein [Candidatus Lokiarchaeota archaeon]